MFSRKNILLIMVLCLAIVLSAACAPDPGTPTPEIGDPSLAPLDLYVSVTGNDENNCLRAGRACRTLLRAFNKATLNSTIHIGAGEFFVDQPIFLWQGITLIGAGSAGVGPLDSVSPETLISSNVPLDSAFAFKVGSRGPVVIRDLTISSLNTRRINAVIEVIEGGNLSLENCRMTHTTVAVLIDPGGSAAINACGFVDGNQGIRNYGNLEMSDSLMTNHGNSVFNSGTASITGTTFQGNNYPTGIVISNYGQMNISSSSISDNYSTAINNIATLVLDQVHIVGNRNNPGRTSSILNTRPGVLTVRSSIIQDNTSYGIKVSGGTVDIHETAIVGNHETGVFITRDAQVTVQNTTISGNNTDLPEWPSAVGSGAPESESMGGIGKTSGYLTVSDSTVILNSGFGIFATGSGTITLYRSVVALNNINPSWSIPYQPQCSRRFGGDSLNFACSETPWTQAELGLGPLTEEAGTLVHPLLPGSPLIDGVLPGLTYLCPPTDQRGSLRPIGARCDIGAYEYEGGSAIAPLEFVTPTEGTPVVVQHYTDTPAPKTPIILTFTKNAYCRKGPGVLYKDISGFKQGDTAQADGRNDVDPRWWWVQIPNSGEHCWVSHTTVDPNDLAEGLPIQPMASLELPEPPSDFVINKRVCTAKSYALRFAWSKSTNTDGYILYRNGEEIATFKPTQTTFDDIPPMDQYMLYELASFNADGYSERLGVEDSCP